MRSLALYIHWPFCLSKCPYCDFNSHVRENIDHSEWYQAFTSEIERVRAVTGPRNLKSIFFGGGTPSLMPPCLVAHIIELAHKHWSCSKALEITLEANPTSAESEKFRDLAGAGVNRFSIGVQSFDSNALTFLGRHHSTQEAKNAIELAQRYVQRVSFDLIYARPGQDVDQWYEELDQALAFQTSHLSLYQLTIEPGTAFATRYDRGDFQLPDEETSIALYEATVERVGRAGLKAYEVSNFAHEGQESLHNLAYWRYEDYAGVGPGAHGRLTLEDGNKIATKQFRAPETWLRHVLSEGNGDDEVTPLTLTEQATEKLLMGLRLLEPLDLSQLTLPWRQVIDENYLDLLIREGFIQANLPQITPTAKGRLCLNTLLDKLIKVN